jgi:GntR family transcriptional regulator
MPIIRTEVLYRQVAAEMRAAITGGAWAVGSQIPSEDRLRGLYGVSRPTIRQAVAALRSEGLLDVQQGRGSFVRDRTPGAHALMHLDVTWQGPRYTTGADAWTGRSEPTTVEFTLDRASALALELGEGDPGYAVEHTLLHVASGTRALHRMVLPRVRIAGTSLLKNTGVPVAEVYAILATAYGDLQWRDTVGARRPQPDERASLELSEAVPLLITRRLTVSHPEGLPLLLETTTLGADRIQVAYTVRSVREQR